MASQRDVAEGLEGVAQRARRVASSISDENWQTTLEGQTWTTHDLFCHIAATGTNLPEFVQVALDPPPDAPPLDIDAWNDSQVGARHTADRQQITAEIESGHAQAVRTVLGLSENEIARPVRAPWGEMVPLGELLLDIVVGHENRHLDQLESLLGDG
jgi:DinB superfamily